MKKAFIFLFFLTSTFLGFGQTPTWEKQISCIVYSHCTSCHNSNGLAPFSLMTYSENFNNRFGILNAVTNRKMPPYLPDVTYSHFTDQKVLSDAEINLISDWVNAGAPSGDTTQALIPPVYNYNQIITNPDLVVRIPNFTIPNTGSDLYQAFVISNPNPTVKYITDIEVVPGNRNVVHHVLVFQDTSNAPVASDSAFAGPGYVSFGGIGSASAKLITGWVPGTSVFTLPAGMGVKLDAGARLIIQIHYPNGSQGQLDSTKINIKYTSTPLRNVSTSPILKPGNMTNGPLVILANTTQTFYSEYTVPNNITVLDVAPHAHLICKKFEVYGVTPTNDTIKCIKIDDWDFHWQGPHRFQQPIKVPSGTVLHGMAFYDNTINNPDNPNNPPQNVTQGEATTDEMMLIYFSYLQYQNGDENIIVDTSSHATHYQNCVPEALPSGIDETINDDKFIAFPNPAATAINLMLSTTSNFSVELVNTVGAVVFSSINQKTIDISNLSNGLYFVKVTFDNATSLQKIIVQR